jgi:hypothetical protein
MQVTVATRHMGSVQPFLSPSRLMHGSTSSADTSTQSLFYHTTHITVGSDHFMCQQAVQTEGVPICNQSSSTSFSRKWLPSTHRHVVTSNKNIHCTSNCHLSELHAMNTDRRELTYVPVFVPPTYLPLPYSLAILLSITHVAPSVTVQ